MTRYRWALKPRRLVWTRRACCLVGCHLGNDTGWEVALDLVLGWRPHAGALVLGWGWDASVPLRPWPQGWWAKHTPRGNLVWGCAWLGFFLNWGTIPRPPDPGSGP